MNTTLQLFAAFGAVHLVIDLSILGRIAYLTYEQRSWNRDHNTEDED